MSEPLSFLKTQNLHSLKSVGYHLMARARDNGEDTAKPLAFVGLVTMVIGATMIWEASKRMERGR